MINAYTILAEIPKGRDKLRIAFADVNSIKNGCLKCKNVS
jgi:hypothetical protein